jgi:hypothetical protein
MEVSKTQAQQLKRVKGAHALGKQKRPQDPSRKPGGLHANCISPE